MEAQSIAWAWRPTPLRRSPEDDFFLEGNLACSLKRKQMFMSPEEWHELIDTNEDVFACQVPGCTMSFTAIASYELHYNSVHRNVCATCKRTFPTDRLLDIHILEWHDSMFELLARKQAMYQCLVAICDEKFPNSSKRKNHMITVHKYPANFRFDKPQKAHLRSQKAVEAKKSPPVSGNNTMDVDASQKLLDGCESCEQFMQISQHEGSMDVPVEVGDAALTSPAPLEGTTNTHEEGMTVSKNPSPGQDTPEGIAGKSAGGSTQDMSSEVSSEQQHQKPTPNKDPSQKPKQNISASGRTFVYNVPRTVCFGQGAQRGFHRHPPNKKKGSRKHWHQTAKTDQAMDTTVNIEEVKMSDLASALSEEGNTTTSPLNGDHKAS